jgi:alpha/beta superfamily hydrolase
MLSRWLSVGLLNLALGAALLGTSLAQASDYAREMKWADEIKSGLVVGEPIELRTSLSRFPFLSLFSPGDPSRAVILAHGMGVHPDWGLIGDLRVALHEHGYTTFSLQMPILPIDAASGDYDKLVPEGAARIARAVSFLEGQGYSKISLVTHSLGGRMGLVYMSNKPNPIVRAWASLGSPDFGYSDVRVPVLDLYGEADNKDVLANAKKRGKSFKNKASVQTLLPGADHFFEGRDTELLNTVTAFLDKAVGKPQLPVVEPEPEPAPAAADKPDAAKPAPTPAPAAAPAQ